MKRKPPYPPLPERQWRAPQEDLPVVYSIDLTRPVFCVGPIAVYARPNGIGTDWMYQINGVWDKADSTQGAVSRIEFLVPFDWTTIHDLLIIDLYVHLGTRRTSAVRRDGGTKAKPYIFLVDPATLENIPDYASIILPYDAAVEAQVNAHVAVFNPMIDTVTDNAEVANPIFAYLRSLFPQAIIVNSEFVKATKPMKKRT